MHVEAPSVTKTSRLSFPATVTALCEAIAAAGNTVFATIDQSAAAEDAGLSLRPTTLIVFGNPKAGTPLMEAYPLVALDLPLKLLVWEDDALVCVAYIPMSEIAARYGVTDMDARIAAVDRTLHDLTESIV